MSKIARVSVYFCLRVCMLVYAREEGGGRAVDQIFEGTDPGCCLCVSVSISVSTSASIVVSIAVSVAVCVSLE